MSLKDLIKLANDKTKFGPDFIDTVRARQGLPPHYRNEAGELPVSRVIISGDDKAKKWLVEYKFKIQGGYNIHHVWEDMI